MQAGLAVQVESQQPVTWLGEDIQDKDLNLSGLYVEKEESTNKGAFTTTCVLLL